MKCPQCGQDNVDGTMICTACDFILDDSFLEEEGMDGDYADEDTPPGELPDDELDHDGEWAEDPTNDFDDDLQGPSTETARGGSYSRPGASKRRQQDAEEEDEPDDFDAEIERQREAMRAKRTNTNPGEAKQLPPHETKLRGPKIKTERGKDLGMEASQIGRDMENMFGKATSFFGALGTHEQIALVGCLVAFLSTVFPWVEIEQQGTRIGLEMGGVFVWMLSAGAAVLIYLSSQKDWLSRRNILIYAEAGIAGITLLFTLSKIFTSLSFTVVSPADGLEHTYAGTIQFGLVLAIIGAGIMAGAIGLLVKTEVINKKKDQRL
ncbi:MAG: hypothetical protein JRF33_11925 [Deltaproteobacteria bacterium]|nr:hypothetical protein [Deltaproteobacteria bacterium]